MKRCANLVLLLLALVSVSTVSAQRGRYYRRYDDHYSVAYCYPPYRYLLMRPAVSVLARLPFGAISVTLGGRPYHYYEGVYYAPYPGGYIITEPPMGLVVPSLPSGAVVFTLGGRSYYRFGTVVYLPLGNGYRVVPEPKDEERAPAKATTTIPPAATATTDGGYEKFVLEGKTFYKKGDKYYRAKLTDSGEVVYEEVGSVIK